MGLPELQHILGSRLVERVEELELCRDRIALQSGDERAMLIEREQDRCRSFALDRGGSKQKRTTRKSNSTTTCSSRWVTRTWAEARA